MQPFLELYLGPRHKAYFHANVSFGPFPCVGWLEMDRCTIDHLFGFNRKTSYIWLLSAH